MYEIKKIIFPILFTGLMSVIGSESFAKEIKKYNICDLNQDGCISNYELGIANQKYKNLEISLSEIIDAIEIWERCNNKHKSEYKEEIAKLNY